METRHVGRPLTRNEDPRLLTGRALFVDDVERPGMLHAAFLRSPHAHAAIVSLDLDAARARPGVVAVIAAADLGDYWKPGPLLVPPPPIEGMTFRQNCQVPLAREVVRHLGEPIVMVVAESRYVAEDAVGDIVAEFSPLPVVGELEAAVAADAPRVHAHLPDNIAAEVVQRKGDYAAARARAAHLVRRRFWYDRGTSIPMETRGIVADWDGKADRLTVWDTTQAPVVIRNGLAAMLGLSERQVRVIAPFIGGGFGPKMMMFYPEEVLIPWIALRLERPVKWIEDRFEHFTATTHERGQLHEAEMALDAEGRILGVRDDFLMDTGAYNPYGLTVPLNSQCTLLNCYDIAAYESRFRAVYTNRTLVTPYRGAGRQHGIFVIERLMDAAARDLGLDRVEIRRRNLIPPGAFPYRNEIIYQDFTPLTYDSGNYAPILAKTLDAIGHAGFAAEKAKAREEGRYLGLGIVCYVEGTGIGPYEGARIRVQSSGKVTLATGIGTQGQGHFTAFAQVVAEQLGVDPRDVEVSTGDTDQFDWGVGTFASRGAVVAGAATHEAAKIVRQKILKTAAEHFECAEADLVIEDGKVAITGVPEKHIALGALAQLANPMRGAVKPGTEPGLEATSYFGPEMGATAAGAHAMVIEIDAETLRPTILRYVVVHDCGTVLNPLILAGQIQGGVAQGIGNAFFEQLAWTEDGQLLNASLADYLIPSALDVPRMELHHTVTPSPLNPLGTKGAGEGGAIPVGPLFAQAIEDALDLPAKGIEITEIPLSPSRLWEIVHGGD